MKIAFLIGNGFDINLGLNTRYGDFYKYYKSVNSPSGAIKNLKKKIAEEETSTWSDLELAWGEYTKNFSTENEFEGVYEDLIDELSKYLKQQESQFEYDVLNKVELFNGLSKPEFYVDEATIKQEITDFKKRQGNQPIHVDVITFNYTRSIERIIEDEPPIPLESQGSTMVSLQTLYHVHGYTDRQIVLGVDNVEQIGNIDFRKSLDIRESLIKDDSNKAMGHGVEEICRTNIVSANLICIFGSSLGKSDRTWWQHIVKKILSSDSRLIIFYKSSSVGPNRENKAGRERRKVINLITEDCDLTVEEREEIGKKIFVAVNSGIFGKNN